ncbi:MAG: flagellin [Lachnospiraceae bacterium]|nr:flagellin [Lachnospiraceae bacterium]
MVVQHNLQAMNANRQLGVTMNGQQKSTEKLSSGYRVNRAADDAAGLAISEKMRKQIRGLDQASTNASDGISAVQTAEGALNEVHDMLQRMNELAVQAANGTNSASDREAIQNEIDQLTTEIDRVAETTKFNETYLLKGDGTGSTHEVMLTAKDAGFARVQMKYSTNQTTVELKLVQLSVGSKIIIKGRQWTIDTDENANSAQGTLKLSDAYERIRQEVSVANQIGNTGTPARVETKTGLSILTITRGKAVVKNDLTFALHVGADADENNKIGLRIKAMDTSGLGIKGLKVTPGANNDDYGTAATYAIDAIGDALKIVSDQRAELGAIQNRLEHTIANLDNVVENTTAAESRIRDTDMASEMVTYSKNQILAQAGQSMLAQANQSTQGVLSLLG